VNEQRLNELRTLIAQPDQMRPVFERLFEEEMKNNVK